jgi:hypothetical protein
MNNVQEDCDFNNTLSSQAYRFEIAYLFMNSCYQNSESLNCIIMFSKTRKYYFMSRFANSIPTRDVDCGPPVDRETILGGPPVLQARG